MKIDEFVRIGSGWVLHRLKRIDFGILRYNPLKASSFIELPKEITRKKACLNIVNRDEKSFMWSVLAALPSRAIVIKMQIVLRNTLILKMNWFSRVLPSQ